MWLVFKPLKGKSTYPLNLYQFAYEVKHMKGAYCLWMYKAWRATRKLITFTRVSPKGYLRVLSWPGRTMCFELVGHQLFFKVLFTLSFLSKTYSNFLTCILVEFKLTLNRDTATEPRQIWRRRQIAAAAHQFQASKSAANLHFFLPVLLRLDLCVNLEKNWKNWLQTWNLPSTCIRSEAVDINPG